MKPPSEASGVSGPFRPDVAADVIRVADRLAREVWGAKGREDVSREECDLCSKGEMHGWFGIRLCQECATKFIQTLADDGQLKDRLERGCRFCGVMNKGSGLRFDWARIKARNGWDKHDLTEGATLCTDCLPLLLDEVVRDRPKVVFSRMKTRLEDDANSLLRRAQYAEDRLAEYKRLRRERDKRRKEARTKRDRERRAQSQPTVTNYITQQDWGMLRVIFSEDSAGTKLINLIAHPATPEEERRTAITKLEGRRIRWQQTTSSETQNTRPATKSARSLASSLGG